MGGALQSAGSFLNSINPWAKHSPSLVENVESGVAAITGHYGNMARSIQSSMSSVGRAPGLSASSFGVTSSSASLAGSWSIDFGDLEQRIAEGIARGLQGMRMTVRIGNRDFDGYVTGIVATAFAR